MDLNQIVQELPGQLRATSWPERIAVLFGLLQVLLAWKNKVWLYPAGLISTAIYTWLYVQPGVGLYAEGLLNMYYFIMSIYGWWLWTRRRDTGHTTRIGRATVLEWGITAIIALGGWLLLFVLLRQLTDSDVPAWDAFVSATAWAGMWLLARHRLENWLLLNLSNAAAIPLYLHKGLALTALLTLVLFIVAIAGYMSWRKQYNQMRLGLRQQGI